MCLIAVYIATVLYYDTVYRSRIIIQVYGNRYTGSSVLSLPTYFLVQFVVVVISCLSSYLISIMGFPV